jgi:phage FluMu protein gp41
MGISSVGCVSELEFLLVWLTLRRNSHTSACWRAQSLAARIEIAKSGGGEARSGGGRVMDGRKQCISYIRQVQRERSARRVGSLLYRRFNRLMANAHRWPDSRAGLTLGETDRAVRARIAQTV